MISYVIIIGLLGTTLLLLSLLAFRLNLQTKTLSRELARARDEAARSRDQLAVEIRERETILATLRSCDDFSATVLNNIHDAISIIDSKTFRIVDVNPVFEREYNLRKEDIVGKTCHEITHRRSTPCGPPYDLCPLTMTSETNEHTSVVHEHPGEDGGTRYVEVSTFPIRNKAGLVVHVSRDISEQKRAEFDLQTAHEALSLTIEEIEKDRGALGSALDEISLLIQRVVIERDTSVRFTNPHLKKCYEVMGCTNDRCLCFGAEAMRCWQIAGTFCGSRPMGTFAAKLDNCLKCSVFQFATSDPIYQIGEYFNNMMHMLELKNCELQEANSELKSAQMQILQQEKMASIGQLAAGIAHEINNPTGFIISNLGSLQKYADRLFEFMNAQSDALSALSGVGADGPRILRDVDARKTSLKIDYIVEDLGNLIHESVDGAERVKKIVQNLKGFSRLDEADVKMSDLNAGLESTITIVWNELKYKATVIKEYGELPNTMCNLGHLNQVFLNLLVNAAQAIEHQGEIRARTWSTDGFIFVAIADNGRGIPPENMSKIFNPFFTTKDVGKGTGLGLSISYDIVRKHNGELSVTSEVNKGTTFTIKLPVVSAKEAAQSAVSMTQSA